MENKDGVVFPRFYTALPTSTASSFSSTPEKDAAGNRKKKSKRKFLRAVKAVLFEISFAKKIKKKVFPRKTKQSNVDPSAKVEKHLNHVKGNSSFQKFSKKNDGTSVTFAPSMNSSAWSSRNSPTNSTNSNPFGDNRLPFESYSSFETQKKQDMEQENNGKGNYSSNTGLSCFS
ncbi:hypothetical protein GH714_024850 [Hevea brasiliensis]|uniref:Uncharacterized protein n=1 Tax=Hevea brasiliensis TaxID=3981 RepID=A0A6A6MP18_HEVBR|nr:hypothetical protein GH714_024850 [Hevea brasiliensis]